MALFYTYPDYTPLYKKPQHADVFAAHKANLGFVWVKSHDRLLDRGTAKMQAIGAILDTSN